MSKHPPAQLYERRDDIRRALQEIFGQTLCSSEEIDDKLARIVVDLAVLLRCKGLEVDPGDVFGKMLKLREETAADRRS